MRFKLPRMFGHRAEGDGRRQDVPEREPTGEASMSEADRIEQEVGRRKKRAEDSRIRECVMDLYYDSLRHYDTWLQKCPEDVHPSISGFSKVEPNGVRMTLGVHTYRFNYEEKDKAGFDGERYGSGTYEVSCDDQRVLKFRVYISYPEEWYDADPAESERSSSVHRWPVGSGVEGPWAAIKQHETAARATREKNTREDPTRLEDLKKRFGI